MEANDSLAVKYRCNSILDLIGNPSVKRSLIGCFKSKKISRSILLSGPTGSGKTTVARIIGASVNCQNFKDVSPCMKCSSCKSHFKIKDHPDINEINASGVEGNIEGIRRILDISNYSPRYNFRTIIIDEAQGIGSGGKKSKGKGELLKPIEEPPKNTIWILCTTNPETMPEALYGRCQKFFLNYPTRKEVKERLSYISEKEFDKKLNKRIEPFLFRIVDSVNNQPRNAISALEQVANVIKSYEKKPNEKVINSLLEKFISDSGVLDQKVMKFLVYLFSNKFLEPVNISSDIEGKEDEFINSCFYYSKYAFHYFLEAKRNKKPNKNLYNLSVLPWSRRLDTVKNKIDLNDALLMCKSCINALIKLRTGSISPNMAVFSIITEFNDLRRGESNGI